MANLEKAKKALMGLVGIRYTMKSDVPDSVQQVIPTIEMIKFGNENKTYGEIIQEINPIINNKKELYDTYSGLRSFHLVVSLLNKIQTDILHKGRTANEPFITIDYPPTSTDPDDKVTYPVSEEESKEITEILTTQVDEFKIESHLEEVLFDALLYGEYYLGQDYPNSELDDTYEFYELIPLYNRGKIVDYIKCSNSNQVSGKVDPEKIFLLNVALPGQRIKLQVKDSSGSRYYVKVPSPFIIPSVIPLLMSITLMERLIPISELMKIDRQQLVSISVPPNTPIQQMFDICKEFEKQVNSRLPEGAVSGFDSIESIVSSFGKYKCIPSVGGQKASMETRDKPMSGEVSPEGFNYLISTLASRLGVPIYYIIGTSGDAQEDPKVIFSYLLKLKYMRLRIAESIHAFLVGYMKFKGYKKFDPNNLTIKLPEIPGTDSLDTTDYMDAMTAVLNNVQGLISGFGQILTDPPPYLDTKVLVDILNAKLEPILGTKLFTMEITSKGEE